MVLAGIRNRLLITLAGIAIVLVILITIPLIEPYTKGYVDNFLQATFLKVDAETQKLIYDEERARPFLDLYQNALNVFRIVLWMTIVVFIVRFLTFVIFKRTAKKDDKFQSPTLTRNIFSISIYIVTLFTVVKSQYPEADVTSIFATSTILGLVIGLALQDTLGNLFAGLALQADEPFKVGDVINIPGKGSGVVESVTWRGVKIRTFANRLLIVSNSVIGKEIFEVAPRGNLNARNVDFSTRHEDSPTKTIETVRELVKQVDNVSPKLRPIVRVKNLGENGIDWEIKYWLEDYSKYNDTDAMIRQRIWYAFHREKIGLPNNAVIVQRDREKPEDPAVVANTIFDRLNHVPLFTPLTEEEKLRLTHASVRRVFAPKEAIVRTGDEGHSMFVIHRGSVNVQLGEKGQMRNVNTLGEGGIFGEMSLFTGQPRSATVTAATETEVLEIGHFALKPLFDSNPDLAGMISKTIADRQLQLQAQIVDQVTESVEERSAGIFNSIKNFFRLEHKTPLNKPTENKPDTNTDKK